MKSIQEFGAIYLHKAPVDGRKWIHGLAAIVESQMKVNAFGGGLFVFINRRKKIIELLYWDKSGFAIWMKRLEEERFRWPNKFEGDVVNMTPQQLSWLLDGFDITRMKPHATLTPSVMVVKSCQFLCKYPRRF